MLEVKRTIKMIRTKCKSKFLVFIILFRYLYNNNVKIKAKILKY